MNLVSSCEIIVDYVRKCAKHSLLHKIYSLHLLNQMILVISLVLRYTMVFGPVTYSYGGFKVITYLKLFCNIHSALLHVRLSTLWCPSLLVIHPSLVSHRLSPSPSLLTIGTLVGSLMLWLMPLELVLFFAFDIFEKLLYRMHLQNAFVIAINFHGEI